MDKRLLFSAVLVASIGTQVAKAQSHVEDPEMPQPVQLKLDGTDTVAIMNVLADQQAIENKWLTKGNAYGTQTSLGTSPLGIAIVPNKDETGATNGTFSLFNNSVDDKFKKKIFSNSFDANGGNSYVDYASQAKELCNWEFFSKADSKYFQFQADTIANKSNTTETRAGWDPNDTGTDGRGATPVDGLFRPALPVNADNNYGEEYGVDWIAYPYEYFYRVNKLKDAINDAIDEGYDMTPVVAIYNNENSKLWQLMCAYEMISEIKRNKTMEGATATAPVSLTQYITNANCDNTVGWDMDCVYDSDGNVGSGGHGTNWQAHSATYTSADGNFTTSKFIERWVDSGSNPDTNNEAGTGHLSDGYISQTLKNLPAGGYKLSCYAMACNQGHKEDGFEVKGISLFANTKSNSKDAAVSTKEGVPQKFEFMLAVKEGEDLTIGYKIDNTNANWIFVDEFQLEYCGSDAKLMNLVDMQAVATDLSGKLGGYSANPEYIAEATTLTEQADAMTTDASEEDIASMKAKLTELQATIEKNVELYQELNKLDAEINDEFLSSGPEGEEVDNLQALLDDCGTGESSYDLLSSYSLKNEDLTAYIAKLNDQYEAARKSVIKSGDDITWKITNPSFENGLTGWNGKATANSTYQNCEAYQTTFDIYQDLTGLPDGVYELKVRAFQRVAENGVASVAHDGGTEDITAFIYANDLETPFSSPYTYGISAPSGGDPKDYEYELNGQTVYIPNSMQGFKAACDENPDAYIVTVPMLVEGGKLRLGVREKKRPSNVNGSWGDWAIWDDFSLKYIGGAGEALNYVTEPLIAKGEGLVSSNMNADVKAELTTAINALKADATIAGIHTLSAAIEKANTSIDVYKTLSDAIAKAQTRYEENEADGDVKTSDAAKAKYNDAKTTAENVLSSGSATDEEIPAAIKALNAGVTQYVIYDLVADASESKPADISRVLINNSFSTMDKTGWDVKDGTPKFQADNNVEAAEFYNTTFDIQQSIVGLPAGTYVLTSEAFYRNGNSGTTKVTGSDELKYNVNENAYLYFSNEPESEEGASTTAKTLPEQKVAIKTITASSTTEATLDQIGLSSTSGLAKFGDVYIPDNMITSQAFFKANDDYVSEPLKFYYDGKSDFRVGMMKIVSEPNDWTIINDFKLSYLGLDPTGISEVVTDADAVATKIYNASGMQINKLQKGINIIETVMKDGSKKVKKVVVK